MRGTVATCAAVLAALAGATSGARLGQQQLAEPQLALEAELLDAQFGAWQSTHGKVYASETEATYRRAVWAASLELVNKHNARDDVRYRLAMNEFADLTPEEFGSRYLMQAPQPGCSATGNWSAPPLLSLPESVDWREKGILSPVKNQGKCGSCWTFSTTGAVESHMALYHDEHLLLSEQQLIDCAGAFDNHGCNGGLPSHAFEYIKYNGGLETEDEYAYKATTGKSCHFDKNAAVKAKVIDSVNITAYDEHSLTAAIANFGPVSIAYHCADDFRLYHSGVYHMEGCPDTPADVNHAVLAVGYGVEEVDGEPMEYYIVKNSWGANWGLNGFFKIRRGVNQCGLSVCNSWPRV